MAKGEGGEQYSNASLLNKQPSSDDIKLTKKVGSFILFFLFLFTDDYLAVWGFIFVRWGTRSRERRRLSAGLKACGWMEHTGRQLHTLNWARVAQWDSSIPKPVYISRVTQLGGKWMKPAEMWSIEKRKGKKSIVNFARNPWVHLPPSFTFKIEGLHEMFERPGLLNGVSWM